MRPTKSIKWRQTSLELGSLLDSVFCHYWHTNKSMCWGQGIWKFFMMALSFTTALCKWATIKGHRFFWWGALGIDFSPSFSGYSLSSNQVSLQRYRHWLNLGVVGFLSGIFKIPAFGFFFATFCYMEWNWAHIALCGLTSSVILSKWPKGPGDVNLPHYL